MFRCTAGGETKDKFTVVFVCEPWGGKFHSPGSKQTVSAGAGEVRRCTGNIPATAQPFGSGGKAWDNRKNYGPARLDRRWTRVRVRELCCDVRITNGARWGGSQLL